ncbi:ferredoxin, partial [Staphylococcus epidermidis]|uniref:ferredoxin n=1 Tax=Staphylococcus epidermidis TaxID=1282 RepID=UPI00164269D9
VHMDTCIPCGACPAPPPDIYHYHHQPIPYLILHHNQATPQLPEHLYQHIQHPLQPSPTHSIKIQHQPFHAHPLKFE